MLSSGVRGASPGDLNCEPAPRVGGGGDFAWCGAQAEAIDRDDRFVAHGPFNGLGAQVPSAGSKKRNPKETGDRALPSQNEQGSRTFAALPCPLYPAVFTLPLGGLASLRAATAGVDLLLALKEVLGRALVADLDDLGAVQLVVCAAPDLVARGLVVGNARFRLGRLGPAALARSWAMATPAMDNADIASAGRATAAAATITIFVVFMLGTTPFASRATGCRGARGSFNGPARKFLLQARRRQIRRKTADRTLNSESMRQVT